MNDTGYDTSKDERLATVGRALGHPARVRIVRLLAAQSECRGSEVFAGLPLAQSTISEHLRILREAGLVSSHTSGTGMVYCLCRETLAEFSAAMGSMATEAPSCAATEEER